MFWHSVFRGILSTLTVAESELYRYPYRRSDEAFRGDWKRIGGDINHVLENLSDGDE